MYTDSTKPHLFLDEFEVDVTGMIVVMIGRVWDVNVVTGRYLSTDFVVFESRGNMIHYTAKASIPHNFLRLKEGGIYSIKNFVVLPNKDEFRILKHDTIMLEFDGETTVRKVSVNDVTGYVTDVGRTNYMKTGSKNLDFYLANQRGQSLRVTFWGGLGDALIERKQSTLAYKLYLLSSFSTIIYDNGDIPFLQELKTAETCVEQTKEGLAIDSSRPREGTLENLLIWVRNRKNDLDTAYSRSWIRRIRGIGLARLTGRLSPDMPYLFFGYGVLYHTNKAAESYILGRNDGIDMYNSITSLFEFNQGLG
ncbi:hypothetical protein Tco_0189289 [Tanacetum coccineum]